MQERNALFRELLGLGLYQNGNFEIAENEVKVDPTDERIDVDAKYSLMRLLKGNADSKQAATGLINAINAGELGGIYGDSMMASVKYAKGHRTYWWHMIAKGEDGCLVLNSKNLLKGIPIIIFRSQQNATPFDGIRRLPVRLDAAIKKAWRTFQKWQSGELLINRKSIRHQKKLVSNIAYNISLPSDSLPRNIYPSNLISLSNNGSKLIKSELTLFGDFLWNPTISDAKEKEFLNKNLWHPGVLDYAAVTGMKVDFTVGNMTALLGEIQLCKAKSIKRLNFFSHANKEAVGISGDLKETGVFFTERETIDSLNELAQEGRTFTFQNKKFVLKDVQEKFADDAFFVLYACDVGASTDLLKAFKNLLKVKVIGFKEKINVCPPLQTGNTFIRKGTKIGINKPDFNCVTDTTNDWRSLITQPLAISI